ncbi:MAG: oxidoreductase [Acidobacteriota bacterium]|nr:oxidoreductase [Acidobacteriota bacterium]
MTFAALVAYEDRVSFEQLTDDDLPKSGVLVDVAYSSLNYKDALAVTRRGRIVRRFPMVLGIDLAGTVVASDDPEFAPGDRVVGHGQGLGENDWGGYAQRQRVRADAIVHVPEGISLEQSMQIGTAGFTAMLCVLALERNGVLPSDQEIVVTGAAGGVGSVAVMLLARLGYRVAASTGRPELESYLRSLGATSIVSRDELAQKGAPMQTERWAGGVDTVGGVTLTNLYAQIAYGGAIACCGMAGGHELNATVWPLILRNVSLLGVSSLKTPKPERIEAWTRLKRDIDFTKLAELSRTEPLSRIFELSEEIMAGQVRGRTVIATGAKAGGINE